MDTNKIEIGTKLEIKIPNINNEYSYTYKSQLIDVIDKKTVSISAPLYDGKYKYLNIGLDLFVYFLDENKDFLFFNAIVKGHRKNGPIEAFDISIVSEISKLQRRDAYRLDTALNCKYTVLDNKLLNTDNIDFPKISNANLKNASTTNISSNGLSLNLDSPLESGTIVDITISIDETSKIRVIAQVKRSLPVNNNLYMVGLHYIKISSQDSAILTKFIFAKQRLMLKNKMPAKFK